MNSDFLVSQRTVPGIVYKSDEPWILCFPTCCTHRSKTRRTGVKISKQKDLKSVTHWHLDRTSSKLEKSFRKQSPIFCENLFFSENFASPFVGTNIKNFPKKFGLLETFTFLVSQKFWHFLQNCRTFLLQSYPSG